MGLIIEESAFVYITIMPLEIEVWFVYAFYSCPLLFIFLLVFSFSLFFLFFLFSGPNQ